MAGPDTNLIKPIRQKIPTMTESEEILWIGSPTSRSMFRVCSEEQCLAYLIFWWANVVDRPTGGQLAFLVKSTHLFADLTGVVGLFATLLIVAKFIHFQNGPMSGKWTLMWTVISASARFSGQELKRASTLLESLTQRPRPLRIQRGALFAVKGFFLIQMISLSAIYQRSFTYAITNKRIHLIKKFMYVDASSQSIGYDRMRIYRGYNRTRKTAQVWHHSNFDRIWPECRLRVYLGLGRHSGRPINVRLRR